MALKNYSTIKTSAFTEQWLGYACNGPNAGLGSPGSSYGYPKTTVVATSGRAISQLSSVNNSRARPWSNFSYRKVKFGDGSGWVQTYTGITCFPFPAREPVAYNNLPARSYPVATRYSMNNGVAWEGFDYKPDLAEVEQIALAKLVASLKDIRTQWNFAVTLGEARETARHLARTAGRLANGFLSFRKGDVVGAYKHLAGRRSVPVDRERTHRLLKRKGRDGSLLDDVSSGWMEFSYAWRPLIGDIDSAARYIAEKRVKEAQDGYRVSRMHFRGRTVSGLDHQGTGNASLTLMHSSTTVAKCRYTYEVIPKFWKQPSTMDELGFSDPATLVWELLPLSFVVDWFINVGQVLESLHELKHWSVKRGIKSTSHTNKMVSTMTKAPISYSYTFGTQQAEWGQYGRSVQNDLPTALPLRIKVANPFDLKKGQMASALVLLRYAFR